MKNLFTKTQTRRTFLKAVGASGVACAIPSVLLADLFKNSYADFGSFLLRVVNELYDEKIGVLMPGRFSDKFQRVVIPPIANRLKHEKLNYSCWVNPKVMNDKAKLGLFFSDEMNRVLSKKPINTFSYMDDIKVRHYPATGNRTKLIINTWFRADHIAKLWDIKSGIFKFVFRAV